MDSPEPTTASTTTATVATATSASTVAALNTSLYSPQVQESPFSNFVSNLSPIKPVKAAPVAQGFLGLNSPPLVFTSPRIISERETSFLPRSQCPRISGAEVVKDNEKSVKIDAHSDDLGKSHTLLHSRLIPGTHNDGNVENSAEDQPGSSSGCVDEYLSEPVEADCANSVDLVNKNLQQSDDLPQLSVCCLTNREEHALKSDDKNELRIKEAPCQVLPEQTEEYFQGHSTSGTMPQKVEDKIGGEQLSTECLNPESGLPVDHASGKQQSESSGTQIVQAIECYGEDVGVVISGPVQNNTQHDAEASELQRGMSRRCLQFEEANSKTTSGNGHSPNIKNSTTGPKSPAFVTDFESFDSSLVDLTVSSSLKQTDVAMFPPHNSVKPPLTVSKPSGIGLHLNSIVSTLPVGHSVTASMKPVSTISFHIVNKNSGSQSSNLVEEVSVTAKDRIPEPKASLATSSATSEALHPMETLSMLPQFETQVTPHNKRKFDTELADNFEEFDRPSFPKKRRKSSTDVDGCKRCNCKKTKCLKLYCDCFAAGIYCADTCACQGCFNRPEYEDTVLETRQSIESRNPLAFAPKIVQKITDSPAINGDDANLYTQSSSRHKRGCNCKKSMCLKRYCECYQANVGCSSGCRCEGCKNVFGRKDEYGTSEEISSRATRGQLVGTADEHVEMVASSKCISHGKLYDLHNLTPLTPSLEYSGYGKDAPKSRLVSRTYVPSPQSDITMSSSYEKPTRSPRNSHGNDTLPGTSKESIDGFSYDQGIDYSINEMMDQLSPRCNIQSDISDRTPLPSHPVMLASSASSKTRDCLNVSRLQLCPGSGSLSSGGSLCWRSSPLSSSTQVVGSKNLARDLDSTLYDILEDDTPEILKEATPVASVKVSSPNKKRVSPPHSHIRQLGSSSSGRFKTGRKFILKAVPSFPSLTPCMDSKDSTNQK